MPYSDRKYSRSRSESTERGNASGEDAAVKYSNPPSPQPWTASSDTVPKDLPAAPDAPSPSSFSSPTEVLCSSMRTLHFVLQDYLEETGLEKPAGEWETTPYDVAIAVWKSVWELAEIPDPEEPTWKGSFRHVWGYVLSTSLSSSFADSELEEDDLVDKMIDKVLVVALVICSEDTEAMVADEEKYPVASWIDEFNAGFQNTCIDPVDGNRIRCLIAKWDGVKTLDPDLARPKTLRRWKKMRCTSPEAVPCEE
ncbi:hypothetical protein DL765_006616 [Monosporascus sp. GIB2]|nr:hypothetical protein DL765_006616 [Monosporascus sp. GIB2]